MAFFSQKFLFLSDSVILKKKDIMFLETSAKTGEGIEEVFTKCVKTILSRIDAGNENRCVFLVLIEF